MARYSLEFASSIRKDLKRIHKKEVLRILDKIEKLTDEPRPEGSKKLTSEELYRIRIGSYRVIYEVFDDKLVVHVVKVGHRKHVYKN